MIYKSQIIRLAVSHSINHKILHSLSCTEANLGVFIIHRKLLFLNLLCVYKLSKLQRWNRWNIKDASRVKTGWHIISSFYFWQWSKLRCVQFFLAVYVAGRCGLYTIKMTCNVLRLETLRKKFIKPNDAEGHEDEQFFECRS